MSILRFINRLLKLDYLIRQERTGTAIEFAKQIGISRSKLLENISEMRELGAEIEYSPIKKTYRYRNEFIPANRNAELAMQLRAD